MATSQGSRRLIGRLLLLGGIVALLCALLLIAAVKLDPLDPNMSMLVLRDKHALLERTPSPRIILIGGSSVPFGIDSTRLESELGRPVVDMGLHAGLGMRFMLSDLLPYVRPGDLVVAMPEYVHFFGAALNGEEALLSAIVDVCPEDAGQLDLRQWSSMSRFLNKHLRRKLSRVALRLFNPKVAQKKLRGKAVMRTSFDAHGDEIQHWELPRHTDLLVSKTVLKPSEYNPEALPCLNAFVAAVRARQAEAVFVYPCLWRVACERNAPALGLLQEKLAAELKCPVLGTPQRYRFETEECYDSDSHLTHAGCERRTALLVEDLRPLLAQRIPERLDRP